jgi:hypothetical protein
MLREQPFLRDRPHYQALMTKASSFFRSNLAFSHAKMNEDDSSYFVATWARFFRGLSLSGQKLSCAFVITLEGRKR